MDNLPIQQTRQTMTDNIVYIEFLNKKSFPPGSWMAEPDLCQWQAYGFTCLALRDMKLGIWRGFVATVKEHKAFNKSLLEIIAEEWGLTLEVYGGLSVAGKLPPKYKDFNKDKWWLGFECSQGEDLLPLVKYDLTDPMYAAIRANQTYKSLHFVRKETNALAKQLLRINNK